MSNFSTEGAIIHEEDIKILDISDDELFEFVWEVVLGSLVGPVADLGHFLIASESATHPVVDAMRPAPAGSHPPGIQVRLESSKLQRSLLNNALSEERSRFDHILF